MSDVTVKVGADSSALATGLTKAERSVDGFGKNAAAAFTKMQAAIAGVGAALAVFTGLQGLLDYVGRVNDLSDRLNETPETLQRIGYAAEQNGADLEVTVKGLQKVSQAAVDASKGNELAAQAFETLNINAADFAAMSTEDKLAALADGFSNAENSTLAFDAVLQLAGKSGAEMVPLLLQGGDAIRETFDSATIASGESIQSLDAVGDRIAGVFSTLKAWGAEALGFLIKQIDTLSVGIAATLNYIGALPQGLKAAQEAFDSTIQAAVELQMEEERAKVEQQEKRKTTATIDPEALQAKKDEKEAAEALEKEKAKLKEDIAAKKTGAFYETLDNPTKANFLEDRISFQEQKIKESGDKDSLESLEAQKKKLELEEKLKAVREDITKDDEKAAKEGQKSAVDAAKDKLKEGEDALTKVKGGSATSIDSLRSIGGGVAGVNYDAISKRDALQVQAVTLAKEQVEYLKKAVALLQDASNPTTDLGDGAFS